MRCRPWRSGIGVAALSMLALSTVIAAAHACGPSTDCELDNRSYRIRMPDERVTGRPHGKGVPAVLFMHGWRGTPDDIMRNTEFIDAIAALGVAVVVPKSSQVSWDIPNAPSEHGLVELPFVDRLLAVLPERHGIDTKRLVAAGFSAGGMMVWHLACVRGDRFKAFVPIAGTFWSPLPESCPSPSASLSHVHGLSDPVVPMDGRPIGERFRQGRVADALAVYARQGGFGALLPVVSGIQDLTCARGSDGRGGFLELCTHPGGHIYRPEPVVRVLRELGFVDGG